MMPDGVPISSDGVPISSDGVPMKPDEAPIIAAKAQMPSVLIIILQILMEIERCFQHSSTI